MQEPQNYHDAARAFANWFFAGTFIGFLLCFALGKMLLIMPLIIGLFAGAVAFDKTSKKTTP